MGYTRSIGHDEDLPVALGVVAAVANSPGKALTGGDSASERASEPPAAEATVAASSSAPKCDAPPTNLSVPEINVRSSGSTHTSTLKATMTPVGPPNTVEGPTAPGTEVAPGRPPGTSRPDQLRACGFAGHGRAPRGFVENPPRRTHQPLKIKAALITLVATALRTRLRASGKLASAEGEKDGVCPICDHPFGNLSHACIGC